MKAIVVFRSKTGYTKRYAKWIAEELGCDIKENASFSDIAGYDTVICGGGVYTGGVNGAKLITGNLDKLSGKKLVLFAVGANAGSDKDVKPMWNRILTDEQQKTVGHFYLRGGFDMNKLRGMDKFLMKMMKSHLEKKKEKTPQTMELLEMFGNAGDFSDRENIRDLVRYAVS